MLKYIRNNFTLRQIFENLFHCYLCQELSAEFNSPALLLIVSFKVTAVHPLKFSIGRFNIAGETQHLKFASQKEEIKLKYFVLVIKTGITFLKICSVNIRDLYYMF